MNHRIVRLSILTEKNVETQLQYQVLTLIKLLGLSAAAAVFL